MEGMGYRGKLAEQERARELRALGWTLTEIAAELAVSKASASSWCRDVVIDESALTERRRQRFLEGNRGARRRGPNVLQRRKSEEIERLREEGRSRVGLLTEREFLVAGLMLYAGEGAKRDGAVALANSDPRMVLFHVSWLRRFFAVDESRLRVRVYLHRGLDLDEAERLWADMTQIPRSQFGKAYRAESDSSIRSRKHPLGCASVTYSCSRTHRSIMGMIDALLSFEILPG
jgi:hypothetical protein